MLTRTFAFTLSLMTLAAATGGGPDLPEGESESAEASSALMTCGTTCLPSTPLPLAPGDQVDVVTNGTFTTASDWGLSGQASVLSYRVAVPLATTRPGLYDRNTFSIRLETLDGYYTPFIAASTRTTSS